MSTKSNNPLNEFFRHAVTHIKLPSGGKYWPDGTLNLPVTGEVPVLPMTTKDEITLRTPDALFNGSGVVSVIKSCCPDMIDPWQMPSVDVDATLIAIRIASYGNKMDIETKCPHCKEENTYEVDLSLVLASIKSPNYDIPLESNGLKIKLQPQKYFSVNKTNMTNFEEQRILQTIGDNTLEDTEKSEKFLTHMQNLVDLNTKIIVDSTESITTPSGQVVTDTTFIEEFYKNADRNVVKLIREWLATTAAESAIKPVKVNCVDCEKEFELAVTFDYANFFA